MPQFKEPKTLKKMKIELTKELKTEIDFMLSELLKGNPFSDNKQNTELRDTSIRICKSLNLIKLSGSGKQYELNENGVLVFNDGGIEKYLFNLRTEKDLELTIKKLTGKRLKYDIWYNIMYVSIGGLISFITILAQPDSSEKYIKQLHKLSSEKNELNDSFQKQLNHTNTLILSLKKEIDSLKKHP